MNLLEMSFSASVMILIVLLVRIVGKKYISKTVIITLWNLVLVRALLPFQIPLGNLPLFKSGYGKPAAFEIQFEGYSIGQIPAHVIEETEKMGRSWQIEDYLPFLWLVGVFCLFLCFAKVYIKEYRLLRKCIPAQNEAAERLIRNVSLHRKIRLYEGSAFLSPVTYGVLCPKIIIPENLDNVSRVDMRNMIAHELVHIQRYDVAKRFVMIAALCVHWFNPLLWVMYRCYRDDQEIACDELVLRNMAGGESKNYVYTMIKMASGGKALWSTTGFVGKNTERKRILAAMNQKRGGKRNIFLVTFLCLCLALPFLSFTKTKEETDIEMPEVWTEIEEPHMESLEAVKKEQASLSPLYEGEIQSPVTENFDYQAVMQDIIENYNDVSQPLTEEQDKALIVQDFIHMASVFKRRQDRGEKLNPRELWVLDEFYEYGE